ncbi:uncharacterized protein LOC129590838 [Paramacrobiotus metropolitanus]|uniref:uncharacterized protein LOC129590838 n=1 Tax=Paramacrobiotus metropolitanus TaxID=2943436 RepID=UPI002445BF05|nr:uncharacterized protein LOC129590838 [Paramacrobiotus metropolitanus]
MVSVFSFVLSGLCLDLINYGLALTMLTGGKSHLEIQEQNVSISITIGNLATSFNSKLQVQNTGRQNITTTSSPTTQTSTRSTTRSLSQKLHFQNTGKLRTTTTTKSPSKVRVDHSGSHSGFRDLRHPIQNFNIPPEKINKFPSPLARLMASLNNSPLTDIWTVPLEQPNTRLRKKRQLENASISIPETRLVCPLEPPCDLSPFQAFLPHEEMVLGFKNGKIHMLSPNGEILIPRPVPVETIFPDATSNVTAALKIKNQIYLFFGTTYMKYRPIRRPPIYPRPVPVPTGFHGVPVPVDAAFQLNAHTYVFVSGPSFVFYQPDANPPVNPAYSPNVLSNIFGGPSLIDTAFNTPDGRRFFLAEKTLYEINDKMQVIKTQPFRKGMDRIGWLDCSVGVPLGCNAEGLPIPDTSHETHSLLSNETSKEQKPHFLENKPTDQTTTPSELPKLSSETVGHSFIGSDAGGAEGKHFSRRHRTDDRFVHLQCPSSCHRDHGAIDNTNTTNRCSINATR